MLKGDYKNRIARGSKIILAMQIKTFLTHVLRVVVVMTGLIYKDVLRLVDFKN